LGGGGVGLVGSFEIWGEGSGVNHMLVLMLVLVLVMVVVVMM
jgi:hypothetical protein